MKTRQLILFLILQLLAIAVAGLSFSLIESRLIAGGVAGSYFLLSGLYMLAVIFGRGKAWAMCMTYPLLAHVFVISLPMLITRFSNADKKFEDVHILGLEGPTFHRLSTTIFTILIVGTLIDLFRVWRGGLKPARLNT